ADAGDYAHAIEDLKEALRLNPADYYLTLRLARVYSMAGNRNEAGRVLASLPSTGLPANIAREVEALRGELSSSENPGAEPSAEEVASLEQRLTREPDNARVLASLGGYYRTRDANRSLAYYRRASDIAPRNADYATGYAAALVQARRFDEAVAILRRILNVEPENYAAHANMAISLYELKRFPESIEEYRWLLKSKPNLAVAHFFVATALDRMGQLQDALTEYETFLAQADAQANQLEIEKVKLRLPSLRQQIRNGQGIKKKHTN
ncbi:MAG TPA: tetratricopeptide repeat protein, partial [Pyrinomonadaceae bacterium]|nr:tetratricopeptide repeat protein [Pyrinomonadaceae bacterium]